MSGAFMLRDDKDLHAIFVRLFTDLERQVETSLKNQDGEVVEIMHSANALMLALGVWLKGYGALSVRELENVARGHAPGIKANAYRVRRWLALVAGELLRRRAANQARGGAA